MISIIEIQTDSPVPNDAKSYYLTLRGFDYILEWDTGRAKILNTRDLMGADSVAEYDIPVYYCDNVISWEDEDISNYSDDETSIFYRENSDSEESE